MILQLVKYDNVTPPPTKEGFTSTGVWGPMDQSHSHGRSWEREEVGSCRTRGGNLEKAVLRLAVWQPKLDLLWWSDSEWRKEENDGKQESQKVKESQKVEDTSSCKKVLIYCRLYTSEYQQKSMFLN